VAVSVGRCCLFIGLWSSFCDVNRYEPSSVDELADWGKVPRSTLYRAQRELRRVANVKAPERPESWK
jgi:hypothetical protein